MESGGFNLAGSFFWVFDRLVCSSLEMLFVLICCSDLLGDGISMVHVGSRGNLTLGDYFAQLEPKCYRL